MLYIFIFLHQTTTKFAKEMAEIGCISLYSYIKPQRSSYVSLTLTVVYLYIPTSNHNLYGVNMLKEDLYIFIFLHQTTT